MKSYIVSQLKEQFGNVTEQFGNAEHFSEFKSGDSAAEVDVFVVEETKRPELTAVDFVLVAISAYAAYLSWSCNTVKKVSIPFKLIYSFFAFMFGVLYVVFYGVFKETLMPCK
jgi:hypothetical protein